MNDLSAGSSQQQADRSSMHFMRQLRDKLILSEAEFDHKKAGLLRRL